MGWQHVGSLVGLMALAVGCSPTPAVTGGTSASTGGAAQTGPAEPRGELKIGADFLPATLDATKAFNLIRFGVAETLMRQTAELKIEPWLAEQVATVDATTWRVTLRANAKFHDGSPVDAQAVAASFKTLWEQNPSANAFIPKDTEVSAVDPRTVQFKTKEPNGAFVANLSAQAFMVFKASDPTITTGMYKPVRLDPDNAFVVEAFREHWGGQPSIARISIRLVRDPNARALGLQAGDVDLVLGLPPEQLGTLPPEIERKVTPGMRIQYVIINHAQGLLTDQALRRAMAHGIDRTVLNKVGFDGQGTPAVTLFPSVPGIAVGPGQTTDLGRARQILDEGGWRAGPDGVRVKDGKRLAFKLISYPQRSDLTPMAQSIQAQLKPLGFDIEIEVVQDINKALAGPFEAAMYSLNTYPTGDPLYGLNTALGQAGSSNFGKYDNAQLNAVMTKLRQEPDTVKRQALSLEAQAVILADAPAVWLVAPPLIYSYRKDRVAAITIHPSDIYLIDRVTAVR